MMEAGKPRPEQEPEEEQRLKRIARALFYKENKELWEQWYQKNKSKIKERSRQQWKNLPEEKKREYYAARNKKRRRTINRGLEYD